VNWARLTANVMVIVGGAVATVLLIDFFPFIGLLVGSGALAIAAILRSPQIAAAVGVGSAVFLVLVLRVLALCDSTVQDCSNSPVVILAWLVALAVAGVGGAVLMFRRTAVAR
jgi:hypothetical protein